MRRPFCCDDSRAMYEDYYARQQKGDGMPVYMGAVHQRGHGLGNMIGSLFRKILPFLQHGAATALRTGARIFEDVRGGKKIVESLKSRVPESIKTFASSLVNQSGSGISKRKKNKKKKKRKVKVVKKRVTKKRKTDKFW